MKEREREQEELHLSAVIHRGASTSEGGGGGVLLEYPERLFVDRCKFAALPSDTEIRSDRYGLRASSATTIFAHIYHKISHRHRSIPIEGGRIYFSRR